ncbi:hypothetical protein SUGI_0321170, partial [Cryptomeria japonica]
MKVQKVDPAKELEKVDLVEELKKVDSIEESRLNIVDEEDNERGDRLRESSVTSVLNLLLQQRKSFKSS